MGGQRNCHVGHGLRIARGRGSPQAAATGIARGCGSLQAPATRIVAPPRRPRTRIAGGRAAPPTSCLGRPAKGGRQAPAARRLGKPGQGGCLPPPARCECGRRGPQALSLSTPCCTTSRVPCPTTTPSRPSHLTPTVYPVPPPHRRAPPTSPPPRDVPSAPPRDVRSRRSV